MTGRGNDTQSGREREVIRPSASACGSGGASAVPVPPAHPKLRVISLFAGIGGFDLGFERTGGFETVAVAETDQHASSVLRRRFPDAPNVGDVTTAEYPDADVICAGFPCQDLSYAGAGAGLAGARSGLFWEVVRAARMVRPRLIVLENVAALLGRGLDVVLRALAEIGYDAEWHCIPASAVGAPHRRDRIWIIAHARSEQHEGCSAPISGALAAELSRAVTDTTCELPHGSGAARNRRDEPANVGEALADATSIGQPRQGQPVERRGAEALGEGQATHAFAGGVQHNWRAEPDVGRVAHGIPKRVDRLRCLGNAVVPQIPELIGRAILQAHASAPLNFQSVHSPQSLIHRSSQVRQAGVFRNETVASRVVNRAAGGDR